MSKERKSIENILLRGSIAKGVNLLIIFGRNILIIPILLHTWGAEKYGLWIAVISFFDLLMSLDDGHSVYISNEFNRLYFTNKDKARHLLGSAVRVAYFSGFVQMIILFFIWYFGILDKLLSTDIESMSSVLLGLGSLVAFRFFVGSFRAILIKTIFPLGFMDRSIYIKTFERLVEIGILILAGLLKFSIMETCFIFATFRFSYSLFVISRVRKWMPDFFPWWSKGDIKTGLKNYFISLSLTYNFFIDRFSRDGLNLIISSTLGLAVLPLFTTVKTLTNFAIQGTNMVMGPLQPELVRFHASKQWSKIIESIKMNWLISNIILNIPFVIFLYFVGDFYEIWTDNKLELDKTLFAFLTVGVLLYNYGNSYMTYLRGLNHIKALVTITTTRTLMLITLSYIFIKYYGITGVGFAVMLTEFITSVNIPFYFVSQKLAENEKSILYRDRIIAILAIMTVAGFYLFTTLYSPSILLGILTVLILLVLTRIQWRFISPEVTKRLSRIIPKKLHNLIGLN